MVAEDEPRWLSPEERTAWMATAGLMMKLPAALDARLQADAGLSFFEYMALAMLSEQPDHSLQMSDLARVTSVSLSRLSHATKRMEALGYLTRSRLPGAGRRTAATLTPAGLAKVEATAPGHVAHVRELVIDAATPAQLAALREVGFAVLERIDPGCVPEGLSRSRPEPDRGPSPAPGRD